MRFLTRRLKAEHYCVLCHNTLSDFITGRESGASHRPEPWERHVNCLLRAIPLSEAWEEDKGEGEIQIFPVDLQERAFTYGNESLNQNLAVQDAQLCRCHPVCIRCNKESSVNFVHVHCLELACKRLPDMPAEKLLSHISHLTRPMLAWDQLVVAMHPTYPYHPLAAQLSRDTELGRLLGKLEDRLPVELQKMIYDHCSGIFRSLLNCSSTIHDCQPLLPLLEKRQSASETSFPLSKSPDFETIGASAVTILGEVTLAQIGASPGAGGSQFEYQIPIARQAVSGIEVSIGTYGVVGLRVLYLDGSKSPWLGGVKHTWTTPVKGDDLKGLQVCSDGIKIVSVELQKAPDSPGMLFHPLNKSFRMLWDKNYPPARGLKRSLIDVGEIKSHLRSNPRIRLAQYLPLQSPEHRQLQSLTMFCTAEGVCRIQVNGCRKRTVGIPWVNVCAMTFYFSPGEVITSIFLINQGTQGLFMVAGPHVMVTTSHGRNLYYGAHHLPLQPETHVSGFDQDGGGIVGLFVDPTTAKRSCLKTLGVVCTPENGIQPLREPRNIYLPMATAGPGTFIDRHLRTAFLSKAFLKDTKILKVQRHYVQCTGLLIIHHDGQIETLGQWDPSDVDATTTLFEASSCERLNSLTFVFSENPDPCRQYVVDIYAGYGCPRSRYSFTWTEMASELAWWFTGRHDCIEKWHGSTVALNACERNLPAWAV